MRFLQDSLCCSILFGSGFFGGFLCIHLKPGQIHDMQQRSALKNMDETKHENKIYTTVVFSGCSMVQSECQRVSTQCSNSYLTLSFKSKLKSHFQIRCDKCPTDIFSLRGRTFHVSHWLPQALHHTTWSEVRNEGEMRWNEASDGNGTTSPQQAEWKPDCTSK